MALISHLRVLMNPLILVAKQFSDFAFNGGINELFNGDNESNELFGLLFDPSSHVSRKLLNVARA